MLGNKIQQIRLARGKTQSDMAKSLGISITSYAKLERGDVDITISRLLLICNLLKVKPFILFLDINPVLCAGDKIDLNEFI